MDLETLGRAWCDALCDALWPPTCRLCGRGAEDGLACAEHSLPALPVGARCGRCARALPRGLPHGYPCATCRQRPPRFTRLVALADYRGAVADWVLAFKHGRRRDLAQPLGWCLARALEGAGGVAPEAWLVPVPLHSTRRLERGYDQALLLARAVRAALAPGAAAVATTPPRVVPALYRNRATEVQGAASAPDRRRNVRGALSADPALVPALAGRRIWLIDDVVTSGATADEAARVLRAAGAGPVEVAALARAGSGACPARAPAGD